MSKFFKQIGLSPVWGNGLTIARSFLKDRDFEEALSEIRKKKMSGQKPDISEEIKDLLEERQK